MVANAATAPPEASEYIPSQSALRIADLLFDADVSSWKDLAAKSGLSRTTLWRLASDPAACLWLLSNSQKAAEVCLPAVHARLFSLAMSSKSPAAIELYLKRFDSEFQKKTAGPVDNSINADFAIVTQMSPAELEKFVQLKRRTAGLETPAVPLSAPSAP